MSGSKTFDLNGDNVVDMREKIICGDANSDGIVDFVDSARVQGCVVGLGACDPFTSDANGDGIVDTLDARLAQRVALGEFTADALTCSAKIVAALSPLSQSANVREAVGAVVDILNNLFRKPSY